MIPELNDLIELIKDEQIREFTHSIVYGAPTEAWFAPASKRHHLMDERGDWGNALHSARVAKLCLMFVDVFSMAQIQADIILSSAIIHDACRHGISAKSIESVPEHPALVRQLANELGATCGWEDEIFEAVEKHMGKWSQNPVYFTDEPDLPMLLHLADVVIARFAEVVTEKKD